MNNLPSRRHFLKTAASAGAVCGLGDLSFLSRLPRVSAQEARLDPKTVRFQPDIEPLVRFLEETPRDKLLEEVAARIHRGLSYREVLAALLLAGVRNIQPRPVGFKFHSVLVVNSAHLASISSTESDRWLPIFWAIDTFKKSQALRDLAAELPADRIMIETDAPYLAPGKFRGKRNEPSYVVEIAKVLAETRGVSFE